MLRKLKYCQLVRFQDKEVLVQSKLLPSLFPELQLDPASSSQHQKWPLTILCSST